MIERYSRPEMRELWSDRARYATWLEVELSACRAMEDEGRVPPGTSLELRQRLRIDAARIAEIEERTRHDVIAFLSHLEEQAGEAVRWLHLGLTSSDVLDTAFALQLRQAGGLLLADMDALLSVLKRRSLELRDLPMVGRTHGMHAEPTSVGLVFAGYYAEMTRNRERLARALDGVAVGKLSGAVGVYGNTSPEVERVTLSYLGLRPETCATQVVPRDRHAELFSVLALLASSLERMAVQVRNWQRSEVGEAAEPFGSGQKGSSAMPHKRNPILAENLCGLARLVRSYATAALEDVPLWHERDISHSSVERVIAPDATTLCDFMLHRMTGMMAGLEIRRERLAQNLLQSRGLVFSESVMLALVGKGLPRQQAYELVQRHALAALEGEGDFLERLKSDPQIAAQITASELEACFDLRHHLRHCEVILRRVLESEGES